MNPKVSIIILNWNGWKDTVECLESLYQITYPNYDVIVVDNGSEDDSIEKIKEYAEGKTKVESKFFEYFSENTPINIIEYTREELIMFGLDSGKGIPRYVEYHEKACKDRLRKIYNSCDIFVFPSHNEGFGMPPMEAMPCKCAVEQVFERRKK